MCKFILELQALLFKNREQDENSFLQVWDTYSQLQKYANAAEVDMGHPRP